MIWVCMYSRHSSAAALLQRCSDWRQRHACNRRWHSKNKGLLGSSVSVHTQTRLKTLDCFDLFIFLNLALSQQNRRNNRYCSRDCVWLWVLCGNNENSWCDYKSSHKQLRVHLPRLLIFSCCISIKWTSFAVYRGKSSPEYTSLFSLSHKGTAHMSEVVKLAVMESIGLHQYSSRSLWSSSSFARSWPEDVT